MRKGSKVGIVCCSNGQPMENKEKLSNLDRTLKEIGLHPVWGSHIFARGSVFSGTGKERAEGLMRFYRDPEIEAVFDISGGEIANEVLPYLDFDRIRESGKRFWGYSDLTTVINGIYAKTGMPSVLYQVRNLVEECRETQIRNFEKALINGTGDLFSFSYEFLRGDQMDGIVVGGNIRCLLKLAGTGYWPDMEGKILFLEAAGGMAPQMTAYLCQLKMMGVFEKIRGILLGTFLKMEEEGGRPQMEELVLGHAGAELPVAETREIGHLANSKALLIGGRISLKK